jgi:hypothetical protein
MDIAPTIAAGAGLPDRTLGLDLGALKPGDRTRSYRVSRLQIDSPSGHLERVERFRVRGPIADPGSWTFTGARVAPDLELRTRSIDLGTPSAKPHLSYHGWRRSWKLERGVTYAQVLGPMATVFLDLPRGVELSLTARLRAPSAREVVVSVNKTEVARWSVSTDFEEHEVTLPADIVTRAVSAISFSIGAPGSAPPTTFLEVDWIEADRATPPR